MRPLVSVIVPTYNYGRYLTEAVRSVQRQSLSAWECVVVDDGSTDDTRAIAEGLAAADPRVRYVYQQNHGLSAARNTGIREARGDLLQFLDSDDMIEPRKLEAQSAFLAAHPETGIVYGEVRYFSDRAPGERLYSPRPGNRPWMPGASGTGGPLVAALLGDNIMVVNCPLVRRTVVDACGDFDVRLHANEDWQYWIRCAAAGVRFDFAPAEGTLALVRHHPDSMSRDETRMIEAMRALHLTVRPLLRDPELLALNARALARADVLEALEAIRRGRRVRGLLALLRHAPRSGSLGLVPYGLKLFLVGR